MNIKYGIEISNDIIDENLKILINQTFKLLPLREENIDWKKPLQTVMEALSGMGRLLPQEYHQIFFLLLCKMEGLFTLTDQEDFDMYRRTIFDCLGLLKNIKDNV